MVTFLKDLLRQCHEIRNLLRRYNPWMTPVTRLILTGFMGAGKSTVGAILARDLGWQFIDLDEVIEASSQSTVAEIFRNQGEAGFREWERQAVRHIGNQEQAVVALGGGTVEDESSRTLLIETPGNCLVFLDAELPELVARCTREGKVRPLLAAPESLAARHERRLPHYRAAHLTVATTGLAPRAVADQVLLALRKRQNGWMT
jgi:shikimate kinase